MVGAAIAKFCTPWVLSYISEVGKHFTTWLYAIQAVLNTESVLPELAITHQCRLEPLKNKWGSVITPITQFQQKLSAVTPRKESGLLS